MTLTNEYGIRRAVFIQNLYNNKIQAHQKGRTFKTSRFNKPAEVCEDCGKMVVFKYYFSYKRCPRCGTESPIKEDFKDPVIVTMDHRFKESRPGIRGRIFRKRNIIDQGVL